MKDFILGSVEVKDDAVVTHRDSYLLQNLSVVSVRRPFLAPALVIGCAFTVFGLGFVDLLYAGEVITLCIAVPVILLLGFRAGQLQLLSRDLKNTELSGAVWGDHSALQSIRYEIVEALHAAKLNSQSEVQV